MFPRLTELHLIGCLIGLIWIPKSKSNTSTPKTNLLTFGQKEVSRVMSGIICCACLTLAISVLQFVLLLWQSELNKNQEKNESQQNRDSQEGADSETFIMGCDATEFVNKVKDQVRSRQTRMSNVASEGEEHSIIW